MDMQNRYDELKWRADVSVRYHSRRQGFYNFCHWLAMMVVVLASSASVAAVAGALDELGWFRLSLPAAATFFGLLDFLSGFAVKAERHRSLVGNFIIIEQQLVKLRSTMTEEALVDVETNILTIEAGEPRVRRVVHAICYNEALIAAERDRTYLVPITFMQRLLANLVDWRPSLLDRSFAS